MSLVTDILDRLSGVSALKERIAAQQGILDRHDEWLLDHEKRLLRLEPAPRPPAKRRRRG